MRYIYFFIVFLCACSQKSETLEFFSIIPEDKEVILNEKFMFLSQHEFLCLNTKKSLGLYKTENHKVKLQKVFNIAEIEAYLNYENLNKQLDSEILNYYYNKKNEKCYLMVELPYVKDSIYDGKSASYHLRKYYLFALNKNLHIINHVNLTNKINDIMNSNVNQLLIPFFQKGFYANEKKIMFSLVTENARKYPYLKYDYVNDFIIRNQVKVPKEIKPVTQESNSFEFFAIEFLSRDDIMVKGENDKFFLPYSNQVIGKHSKYINSLNHTAFYSNTFTQDKQILLKYPDSVKVVNLKFFNHGKNASAITKTNNAYYHSSHYFK